MKASSVNNLQDHEVPLRRCGDLLKLSAETGYEGVYYFINMNLKYLWSLNKIRRWSHQINASSDKFFSIWNLLIRLHQKVISMSLFNFLTITVSIQTNLSLPSPYQSVLKIFLYLENTKQLALNVAPSRDIKCVHIC